MNLRDKLRAVGGNNPGRPGETKQGTGDCRHFAVYRPAEEFPGAWDLTRETLALMSEKEMPGSCNGNSLALTTRKLIWLFLFHSL